MNTHPHAHMHADKRFLGTESVGINNGVKCVYICTFISIFPVGAGDCIFFFTLCVDFAHNLRVTSLYCL